MNVSQRGSFRAKVEAEHRDGICETCGEQMVKVYNDIPGVPKEEQSWKLECPKCGGTKGRLIARSISIQAPSPPQCIRLACVWRFFCQIIFCGLLSQYHYRRVMYAEKNRRKNIPIKYRTGENAPENIRQALLAIIKLKLRR